jgi:aldehyde:ferredoxin oxidoreductase
MTEQMGKKEGFGAVLVDGVKSAAQQIGGGASSYAIHIGGQEVPGHSPVAGFHWPATYIANATPGRHTQGSEGFSQELLPEYDKGSFSGRGVAHKIGTCHQHVVMCTGMCLFVTGALRSAQTITDFLAAVTGWDRSTDDLLKVGERIENMRQAFNIREGHSMVDRKVPPRILGRPPAKEGPLAGISVDGDTLVREYLEAMEFDSVTGRPSRKKLLELGLDDVAASF